MNQSLLLTSLCNGDQGADQVDVLKYSQDHLEGIDGLMMRSKTKRMKETLQGLIIEVQYKEAVLEESKTKFKDSNASPRMVYYLSMQGIDLEDQVGSKEEVIFLF